MPIRMDAPSRIPAPASSGQSESAAAGQASAQKAATGLTAAPGSDTLAECVTHPTTPQASLRAAGVATMAALLAATGPRNHLCSCRDTTTSGNRVLSGMRRVAAMRVRPGLDRPQEVRRARARCAAIRRCRVSHCRCTRPASLRPGTAAPRARAAIQARLARRAQPGHRLLAAGSLASRGAGPPDLGTTAAMAATTQSLVIRCLPSATPPPT